MGSKNCLKEQVLGPSTNLLVGFTLNLTYRAPTQAWLYPYKYWSLTNSLTSSLFSQFFLNYSSYSPFSNQPNNGLVPLLYPWVSGVASFLFPLTHVFPHLLESQGILTKLEDSLGTCSRRRLRLGSGFFSQSLDLGYQPYSDRI